ncbi:MAG: TolC family protein [Blastochloris sp.]|nr:TolC family protein [Blastochloris sp.]
MKAPFHVLTRRRLGLKLALCLALSISVTGILRPEVSRPAPDPVLAISLERCLEMAFEHNAELRQASTASLDAQGRAIGLRAILYPKIATQALSTPATFYVQVEQIIYDRAQAPNLELARLAPESARIQYQAVLQRVAFELRQRYSVALARQHSLTLLEEDLRYRTRALDASRQLFEAGRVQKSEVTRLEVRTNQVQQELLDARLEKPAVCWSWVI